MPKTTTKRAKAGTSKRVAKNPKRSVKRATRSKKTGERAAHGSKKGAVKPSNAYRATEAKTEPSVESVELMEMELVNGPDVLLEAEEQPELSLLPTSMED